MGFFNSLWVVIPLWVMYVAYGEIVGGLRLKKQADSIKKVS